MTDEQVAIAAVVLVWGLGISVSVLCWAIAASIGDVAALRVSTAVRTSARWLRAPVTAPTWVVRTPTELVSWKRERDARAATIATGVRTARTQPSADTLAAWASQTMGLRMASDVAPTVVSEVPVAPVAAELPEMSEPEALTWATPTCETTEQNLPELSYSPRGIVGTRHDRSAGQYGLRGAPASHKEHTDPGHGSKRFDASDDTATYHDRPRYQGPVGTHLDPEHRTGTSDFVAEDTGCTAYKSLPAPRTLTCERTEKSVVLQSSTRTVAGAIPAHHSFPLPGTSHLPSQGVPGSGPLYSREARVLAYQVVTLAYCMAGFRTVGVV